MTHYKVKPYKLHNDPKIQWADYYDSSSYFEDRFVMVPVDKIHFKKWNQDRYDFYMDAFKSGRAADPVRLSRPWHGGDYFEVSDGNHRTAASIDMGYTHVPAIVSVEIKNKQLFSNKTETFRVGTEQYIFKRSNGSDKNVPILAANINAVMPLPWQGAFTWAPIVNNAETNATWLLQLGRRLELRARYLRRAREYLATTMPVQPASSTVSTSAGMGCCHGRE